MENPAADTTIGDPNRLVYGNTLQYSDSLDATDLFYPPTHATHPQATDIPNPAVWLPGFGTTYRIGQVYDGTPVVGNKLGNNPLFVNYVLPQPNPNFHLGNYVGSFDFHLQSTSPAIGKGYTGFIPKNATSPITNPYLKATVTPPNIDLGAYPTDGSGNQH